MSVETWKAIFDWGTVVLIGFTFVFGAGALITGNILSERQEREIAQLKKDAGNANEKTGEANERAATNEKEAARLNKIAEDERTARIELESKVAWRRIEPQTRAAVASHLAKFAGIATLVTYNPNDAEGSSFALDVATMLHAANWAVSEPLAMLSLREGPLPFGTNAGAPTGVLVWSTDDESSRQAATRLVEQLVREGFNAALSADIRGTLGVRPNIRVAISVEHKPEGPQGEYKLRDRQGTPK